MYFAVRTTESVFIYIYPLRTRSASRTHIYIIALMRCIPANSFLFIAFLVVHALRCRSPNKCAAHHRDASETHCSYSENREKEREIETAAFDSIGFPVFILFTACTRGFSRRALVLRLYYVIFKEKKKQKGEKKKSERRENLSGRLKCIITLVFP